MGDNVADSADGVLQNLGYAYNWWRIFLLVLGAVGLSVGGVFVQTEYRKGWRESRHLVTDIACEDDYGCNQNGRRGLQQRRVCKDCTVTGAFGTLDRTYENGTAPAVNDEVVVFEAPSGELTLDPGVPNWLHIALYAGGGVCLVGAIILFALRNSKWFRRAQGVSLGLSFAGR